jgi:lipid-A-disaccharide synthase
MPADAPHVLLVAGEASGDLHAASLLRALKERAPGLRVFGMGGTHCQSEGLEALADARDISVMGLVEVLPAIPRILGVMRRLVAEARVRKPDLAILVDLPDFNLRLARKLKAQGIPVVFYVSPTVWAWRKGRIKTIKKVVDVMLCIFPFEAPFYAREGVEALYVGNPTLDELGPAPTQAVARAALGLNADLPVLALLPGSRRGEIRRILPAMLQSARALLVERPGMQVVIPVAPTLDAQPLREEAARHGVVPIFIDGRAPEVVAASDAAIVASGTAVLEASLMLRPLVVVYRVAPLTYFIAKRMVKVAHVAIVNLLAGRLVVPELIQGAMTPARIVAEVRKLLDDPELRARQLADLSAVRSGLGEPGASARAAEAVLALWEKKKKRPGS